MKEYITIPLDRIAVIVGPNGEVKEFIEEKSMTSLNIDSQTGEVEMDIKDPIKGLRAKDVVNAIANGFNPEKAFRLFDDDLLVFETIDLSNIAKTEKYLQRIKGRIIGGTGKTREIFESLTDVSISVYGKTISIIGYPEQNNVARKGIDMLLKGSPQRFVYKFLERYACELKRDINEMDIT
jgi:ribosomal RNA assembly protein